MTMFEQFTEVCDLPYYTEPDILYETRMRKGIRVRALRDYACEVFGKQDKDLTVRDLKLAFLKMYPFVILTDGNEHEVTVKKYNGRWILSCDCKSWIFNLSGDRSCKHTLQMERILDDEGR
jgi:hypothetical protein